MIYDLLKSEKFRLDLGEYLTKNVPELIECSPNYLHNSVYFIKRIWYPGNDKEFCMSLLVLKDNKPDRSYRNLWAIKQNTILDDMIE